MKKRSNKSAILGGVILLIYAIHCIGWLFNYDYNIGYNNRFFSPITQGYIHLPIWTVLAIGLAVLAFIQKSRYAIAIPVGLTIVYKLYLMIANTVLFSLPYFSDCVDYFKNYSFSFSGIKFYFSRYEALDTARLSVWMNSITSGLNLLPYIFLLVLTLMKVKPGKNTARKAVYIAMLVCSILYYLLCAHSSNPFFPWINFWSPGGHSLNSYLWEYVFLGASLAIGYWLAHPSESEIEKFAIRSYNNSEDVEFYVSMGKHIALMLLTGGIWLMIWVYKATIYTNRAKNEEERSPVACLLLSIFVPFYMIYWIYKTAQRIDSMAKEKQIHSDLATTCLILSFFIGIVPPILMQDKINQIVNKQTVETVTDFGTQPYAPNQYEARSYASIRTETNVAHDGNIELIIKYKDLYDQGVITEEEFSAKKRQLLDI